jgi:DNA-binding transcriptional MerR regulator
MPYKEKEIEKLYYSISEVAKMFQVNASLIRFWEKEFDLFKPKKNKKGDRVFAKEDIATFRMIHHLVKERGFTLDGAREKMRTKEVTMDSIEMVKSLERVKQFLLEMKNQL